MLAPTAIPTLAPVERPGAGSDADAEVEVEVDDVSLVDVAVDVWVVEDYRLGRGVVSSISQERGVKSTYKDGGGARVKWCRKLESRRVIDADSIFNLEFVTVGFQRPRRCPCIFCPGKPSSDHHNRLQVNVGPVHQCQGDGSLVSFPSNGEWFVWSQRILVVGKGDRCLGERRQV